MENEALFVHRLRYVYDESEETPITVYPRHAFEELPEDWVVRFAARARTSLNRSKALCRKGCLVARRSWRRRPAASGR